jgi:hypothetical protein
MRYCSRNNKGLGCILYSSSAQLPAEWNALLPEGHALQTPQLSVTENSSLPDISHLYALIYVDDIPVAAAYFQVLNLKPGHINHHMVKPWQHRTWRFFTKTRRPKMLVSGHLFRHDTTFFYHSPNISSYQAFQCFYDALNAALSKSCASAILVKDMPKDLVNHFQNHAPEYLLLRNDISMEMNIDPTWCSIHDYEKSLKHKYAQRFRKVRQQWQNLEIKELSAEELAINKNTIHALYEQVAANQQVRLGLLSADFLPNLKKHYGDKLKIWAAYKDGEMTAFFSGWAKHDAFDMFYIGFDYSKNAELQSYFNILFFAVEQAIALKKSKLILGRTALDAKARIGCEPRYLQTFLFINNGFLRRFVLRKQKNVSLQEGDWEEKHPFKPAKD